MLARAFYLSGMLVEFSLKRLYSTMCGKNFQIYGVHILRKCIDPKHFLLMPLPTHNWPPTSCHQALGRRKSLFPLSSILSKICFPQQQKEGEETMICFIKIQLENMKRTWNIRFFIFCMTCNFFKRDGFIVLKIISII